MACYRFSEMCGVSVGIAISRTQANCTMPVSCSTTKSRAALILEFSGLRAQAQLWWGCMHGRRVGCNTELSHIRWEWKDVAAVVASTEVNSTIAPFLFEIAASWVLISQSALLSLNSVKAKLGSSLTTVQKNRFKRASTMIFSEPSFTQRAPACPPSGEHGTYKPVQDNFWQVKEILWRWFLSNSHQNFKT